MLFRDDLQPFDEGAKVRIGPFDSIRRALDVEPELACKAPRVLVLPSGGLVAQIRSSIVPSGQIVKPRILTLTSDSSPTRSDPTAISSALTEGVGWRCEGRAYSSTPVIGLSTLHSP